jgi:hypothetical protein
MLPQLEVELYYLHLTGIFERIAGANPKSA